MNKFSNKKIWIVFSIIIGVVLLLPLLGDYHPYDGCGVYDPAYDAKTDSFNEQLQHKYTCSVNYVKIRMGIRDVLSFPRDISLYGPMYLLPSSFMSNDQFTFGIVPTPLGMILILIFDVSIIYFLSVILVKAWDGIKYYGKYKSK